MSKLADIRAKRGFSQRQLAKTAKINFVTIARIESGIFDPRLSTLRALAKALKVKVADLIDEE
jgi:transcriptional regulator with XRE-family HTH domain